MIAKLPCQKCGVNIEFVAEQGGEFVSCPSCGDQTRLIIPSPRKIFRASTAVPTPPEPKQKQCSCCDASVSIKAKFCVQCGEPFKDSESNQISRAVFFVFGLLLIIFSFQSTTTIYQDIYYEIKFGAGCIMMALALLINRQ